MSESFKERSVVLVKPDGVARGLVGEIISRFEKMGIKIIGMKMIWVDREMAGKHYPDDRVELLKGMGEKTLATYEKYGKDANEEIGTKDPVEIGRIVNSWNLDFLTSGPVVAILFEGYHAIENIRATVGSTMPAYSAPGTIRGDYSTDSPAMSNSKKRAVHNLIHASGNKEEANHEQQLWFKNDEIYSYKRSDEDTMY